MNLKLSNMNYVNCPLCLKNDCYPIFSRGNSLIVVKCRFCKFMYVNPRSNVRREVQNTEEYYKQYIKAEHAQRILFGNRFKEFLTQQQHGKVLDIGCATGTFLTVAQENGWEAVGIDMSEWAYNYLRKGGFNSIYQCTLEEAEFPDEYFNAVHLSHILEHIPDPGSFLIEIHRILEPKGLVIIEVPNESKFPWNYKLIQLFQPLHRPKRRMTVQHLSLFSPKTMRRMLAENGFSPVIVRSEGFSVKGRMQTPMFQKASLRVFLIKMVAALKLDIGLGFGRYIVAMAEKAV